MSNNKEKDEEKPIVAKTAVDLQRLKLLKLMKNPDKPIILPERPKPKNNPTVPEFVRNVMGSSAGAGSGEFHVYRHLRRKEYARQKFIQEKGHKELLDAEYHEKLEQNKKQAEDITAKKRAKRLKRKQKMKGRKKMKGTNAVKNNNKENSDTQHSDTDDSDAAEEINESKVQSDVNNITPMQTEPLREVEYKERMEVENNDKEYKESNENNSVQSDVTGDKNTLNHTTSTEVEQFKQIEDKDINEVEYKEKDCKENSEVEHTEVKEENEIEYEEVKKINKIEHEEVKEKGEIEHEVKETSKVENKDVKEKSEVECKEEEKGNNTTNMV